MPETIKLAEYLFRRLIQLGIGCVHGVPGDFNLTLLDYVEPSGLQWVGNANELNAGYAADGYSRIKGIGALITTFGVGELSAINSIAGAYSERAAVVHIVGTPSRALQDARTQVHHTLNDGDFRRFGLMHAHVTVAQTSLWDPRTSPEQIDEALRQCLLHSRPVYIEVPVDMVDATVSAERLRQDISIPVAEWTPKQDAVIEEVLKKMYNAKKPLIFVDGETRALGIIDDVQYLVSETSWPTWTTAFAKGLLDETLGDVHGIYCGSFDKVETQKYFKEADLILCFGPHFSSTNSFAFTALPDPAKTISFTDTSIKIGNDKTHRDIPVRPAMQKLVSKLAVTELNSLDKYGKSLPRDQLLSFSDTEPSQPITQDKLWKILPHFLRPGDIVLGETGTSGYGAREFKLPPNTRLFTPVTWLSIGYMLPAAQGVALAQRELASSNKLYKDGKGRVILIIGDGSFQMTVQEIGTIIRLNLPVIIFLVNNDGYTIERCIHGVRQKYNDINPMNYLQAPSFFGGKEDSFTAQAKTWSELEKVLGAQELTDGEGLRMVEIFMDKEDAPEGPLKLFLSKQKEVEEVAA
jgi:pyruvate decarboxylase